MKKLEKLMALVLIILSGLTLFTRCTDEDDALLEKSSEKKILVFRFDQISPVVIANIDQNSKTIITTLPSTTNLKTLTPYVEVSEKATVSPSAGAIVDFTSPVHYTVTAEDGSEVKYIVTISLDDPLLVKSAEKNMVVFRFDEFIPAVIATIDQTAKTVTAELPKETDLGKLTPYIELSEMATVSPASGAAISFTAPVNYIVTAEDGSEAVYVVTVSLKMNMDEPLKLENFINENHTLIDRGLGIDYIVEGTLEISEPAVLTIEPGVTIAFISALSGVKVNSGAGLKMIGTAEKPIVLTTPFSNDNKGAWAGIILESSRTENQMAYVQIKNAGNALGIREGAIYLDNNSTLRMNNSFITGALTDGIIIIEGTLPVFNNNTISGCEGSPIWSSNLNSLGKIGSTNSLANNKKPYIYIGWSVDLSENLTFSNPGVPIRFAEDLGVRKDLNLQKGVVLEFNSGKVLTVVDEGMINALGDAENPVIFTGAVNEEGFWGGISIQNSRNNRLENCIVTAGGYNTYSKRANISMWDNSKLTLSNVKLMNSSGYGFQYEGSINLSHSAVTFDQCALGNVYDYDKEVVRSVFP
ncbi:MAG TPA: DUF5018 domain-containing protein [Marinilabiliaceae bacterium]|nr:DUF5018 domain-containing protein [Marinilabiliaceae bacterium]